MQVKRLTGLQCLVDPDWSVAVLRTVAPHLEELEVRDADLRHLRLIQGMAALRKLDVECACSPLDGGDVPTLPLQLEDLRLHHYGRAHLLSIQWMPGLRRLELFGYR